MIPFIVGAAVGAAAGYLLADGGEEKKSSKENDENISQRIVSDEYVRSKMKKLGREIRRV